MIQFTYEDRGGCTPTLCRTMGGSKGPFAETYASLILRGNEEEVHRWSFTDGREYTKVDFRSPPTNGRLPRNPHRPRCWTVMLLHHQPTHHASGTSHEALLDHRSIYR